MPRLFRALSTGVAALALGCAENPTPSATFPAPGPTWETFETTQPFAPTDILFVVDDSLSMEHEQGRLGPAVAPQLDRLDSAGFDYHVGVTTTDMGHYERIGKLLTYRGDRYLTHKTEPSAATAFASLSDVGISGSGGEKGRLATYHALQTHRRGYNGGFLRDDATLMVIYVSDEDDHSADEIPADWFLRFLENRKERPEDVVTHAITWLPGTSCPDARERGREYVDYADWTGGVTQDICESDWSTGVEAMFDWLDSTARVVLPSPVQGEPEVNLDDELLDPPDYTWNPDTHTVYFDVGVIPAPGQSVRIDYLTP